MNRSIACLAVIVALAGCSSQSATQASVGTASVTVSTEAEPTGTTTSTVSEVFTPTANPEVVFSGPLEMSDGSLVVRYEPNAWYRDSGIVTLPTVGDLRWFITTEDGCQELDRAAFVAATGAGHTVSITPAPNGQISVGESIPLWIEGDWFTHDGCAPGDPVIVG